MSKKGESCEISKTVLRGMECKEKLLEKKNVKMYIEKVEEDVKENCME